MKENRENRTRPIHKQIKATSFPKLGMIAKCGLKKRHHTQERFMQSTSYINRFTEDTNIFKASRGEKTYLQRHKIRRAANFSITSNISGARKNAIASLKQRNNHQPAILSSEKAFFTK